MMSYILLCCTQVTLCLCIIHRLEEHKKQKPEQMLPDSEPLKDLKKQVEERRCARLKVKEQSKMQTSPTSSAHYVSLMNQKVCICLLLASPFQIVS